MAEGSLYKALWRKYKGGKEGYGMTNKNQANLMNQMDAEEMPAKRPKKKKKRKKNGASDLESRYSAMLGR